MDELQEMREQMAALKEKLNKQEIITEQNLRHIISKKIHILRIQTILGSLSFPFLVLFSYYYNRGTIFEPIAWGIVGAIMIFFSIKSMLLLKKQDIISGNIKDVLPKLYQMRQRERGPLSFLWISSLPIIIWGKNFAEICQSGKPFGKYHLLFIAIGLIFVGLSWLVWKFIIQKQPSQWDEYIRQLEEITKDDEQEMTE